MTPFAIARSSEPLLHRPVSQKLASGPSTSWKTNNVRRVRKLRGKTRPAGETLWFGGEPLAQINNSTGEVAYYFNDHLGTPILQTNQTAQVVWRAEYEPYGQVFTLRAGEGRHQPLRLPGQEAEQFDSGANGVSERSYNIFRWYRAGWGRYTQADPVGLNGLKNRAVFVKGTLWTGRFSRTWKLHAQGRDVRQATST